MMLPGEILVRIGGRRQQQVRDLIGYDAIDLLRHGAVEAAQACLDVRDGDEQLGRDQRRGHGRVHVTDNRYQVGAIRETDLFEFHHHPRGLDGVARRSDFEIAIRDRQVQLADEHA
jgi:hypothetical protein